MSHAHDLLSVADAASALGITPSALRHAIRRKLITPVPWDKRTYAIRRSDVEQYRREHLGQRGKRPRTENPPQQQAYQQAYYQRRKAARTQKQQPAEPAE